MLISQQSPRFRLTSLCWCCHAGSELAEGLLLLVPVLLGALCHLSPEMPLQQYWGAVSQQRERHSDPRTHLNVVMLLMWCCDVCIHRQVPHNHSKTLSSLFSILSLPSVLLVHAFSGFTGPPGGG